MIKKTHILYALFTELITPRYITCAVFNHNIILPFFLLLQQFGSPIILQYLPKNYYLYKSTETKLN